MVKNMAQEDLIPMSMRSKDEVKKIARKGGLNSGKARRDKALLKDCLQILMEKKYVDEKTGKKLTGAELLSVDLFEKALKEVDTAKKAKAFEVIRDSSGQKPVDKVEQTNTNITIDFGDLDEDQGTE